MTSFGDALRSFRQASNDPQRFNRRLSQERLGELIGHEMDDLGFTGAAVSDWERGESKISAEDRDVLMALIKVLHDCGGLQTGMEANQLLEAGNYRALNTDETLEIFPPQAPVVATVNNPGTTVNPWALFFRNSPELQADLEKAMEGPSPVWPRWMVVFYRRVFVRLSPSHIWMFIVWVWLWVFAWWLITPSLRWPFPNRDDAFDALFLYAVGAIVIPALIGLATNTRESEFWKDKKSITPLNLRLYTHQGAGVGFHVGYYVLFAVYLLLFNLDVTPARWFEFLAMVFPLFLGYASARLVPYNLLMAYKRLHLQDGAIFFVFFLLGPVWAYFFYQAYDILLDQAFGVLVFLFAMTLVAGQAVWKIRRSKGTFRMNDGR